MTRVPVGILMCIASFFITTHCAYAKDVCHNYVQEIAVGTPPRLLNVIIDTGSSVSWIHADSYEPKESDTYKKLSSQVEIEYGSMSIQGETFLDIIEIDGVSARAPLVLTRSNTREYGLEDVDGIIGVGFPALGFEGMQPVLDVLMSTLDEEDRYFSGLLGDEPGGTDCESVMAIGHGEMGKGAISLEVVSPGSKEPKYWAVHAERIAAKGADTVLLHGEAQVVFDTGTALITGPSEEVKLLQKQIDIKEDCSNFKQLPPLEIELDGVVLSISPQAYVLREVEGGQDLCISGFFPMDLPGERLWLLGTTVLEHIHVVYRRGAMAAIEIAEWNRGMVSVGSIK